MNLELLQSHGLLNMLPPEVLARLSEKCKFRELLPGEVVLTPGQTNHTLFFLLAGLLQVHLDCRGSGNSFTIQPGEIIGEMSIIEHRPVSAWVVVDEPSLLLAMPEQVFWDEFVSVPYARRGLLQLLISRVRKTDAVLLKELERKARYELLQRELESAGKIQASILPNLKPLFPQHPQIDTHALIKPAREVGGDFFDALTLNEHTIYVAVGDVSGKGMPAALFMVRTLTLLRLCLLRETHPAAVLPAVNRFLCEANEECMFVSLAVGVLDTRTGKLIYLNGGHNPPFLSTKGEPYQLWEPPKGMLLGVNPRAEFVTKDLTLAPGDTLVLYTDGVSEAEDPANKLFQTSRAMDALSQSGPGADLVKMFSELEQALSSFTGDMPQSDDITLLALRYRGESQHCESI